MGGEKNCHLLHLVPSRARLYCHLILTSSQLFSFMLSYDLPCTWWSLSYSSRRWQRKCSHLLWRPHLSVCNSAFRQILAQTWADDIWFNVWLWLIIPCAKGNQWFLVIATIWAELEHLWTAQWKESVCKNYLMKIYLVKSHIRHPDIVLLVHSYHVR